MERGKIAPSTTKLALFVFEGLIAHETRRVTSRALTAIHRDSWALDLWEFDVKVCDTMYAWTGRFDLEVGVLTWRSPDFAKAVLDRLWGMDIPVRFVKSTEYRFVSHRYATDPDVVVVFDPDPAHRFGYGFKCREFTTSERV